MTKPAPLTLWRHARLASMAPNVSAQPWGWVEQGALLTEGDRIHWVGAEDHLPRTDRARIQAEHDLQGALVTPGLIDCHTHLVYAATARANSSCGCRAPATRR